jgi:hypothetical protein
VVAAACLSLAGCGSPLAVYQEARSGDGRCVFRVTEYTEPKDGDRVLALQVVLDGGEVAATDYIGTKWWGGHAVRFEAVAAGRFYCLGVTGHPGYAIAAVDADRGVVWCNSSDGASEYIVRAFRADPAMPRLTDMNWLWTSVVK